MYFQTRCKDERNLRKVFTRDTKCGLHTSGYGLQVPIIFYVVSVGSHYLFKRHWVPHFLPNLAHISRLTPIFTHIFPVFVLCTPILATFMLQASLLTPIFCSGFSLLIPIFLSFWLLLAHQRCYCSYEVMASGCSYHQKLGP